MALAPLWLAPTFPNLVLQQHSLDNLVQRRFPEGSNCRPAPGPLVCLLDSGRVLVGHMSDLLVLPLLPSSASCVQGCVLSSAHLRPPPGWRNS